MTNESATESWVLFVFYLTLWIAKRKCNALEYEDDTENGTDAALDTHLAADDIDGNYLLSFQSQHITYFNISLIFTTKSEIIQSIHSSCSLLTVSITIFIVITNHCFRYTLSATYHNVSMTKLNWTTVEYQDMRPNYGWPGRLGHLLKLCNTGQSGNLSIRVHNFVRICHILSCLFIWNKQVINYLQHNW